jgi:hypothetical protein
LEISILISVLENAFYLKFLVYYINSLRKFNSEDSSPDIIRHIKSRIIRWAGHVARMGEGRNVYRVLMGKPEGKRPLERPRRRREDGIKMDLTEIGWGGVEWIYLPQVKDRRRAVVNAVMNLRVLAPRS